MGIISISKLLGVLTERCINDEDDEDRVQWGFARALLGNSPSSRASSRASTPYLKI